MPSYFLPYPKTKSKQVKHTPPPLQTSRTARHPYPHPQPDPPNNPPSPLNLSSPATSSPSAGPHPFPPISSASSASPSSSWSSSSSSTIKPSTPQTWSQDYHPSVLKLQIVCGNPHDPSLVVVFGLKFREGKRPQVRFSVKRGHGMTREPGETLGLRDHGEGDGWGKKVKREEEEMRK
ncbi:hypothetical protein E4T44_07263 [Aureobasidium sp. EXF-8845]|nr:hypothetical protein E4T44_07263 [Aureobasidium sp. EXF-8845]KAI4848718.1 hypothetical protein E4T45_06214 [Aureobasidium sp. EXF-8846]